MEAKEQSGRKSLVHLSKALSAILRHRAVDIGIEIRTDGCVRIAALLSLRQFAKYSLEDIHEVVRDSEKQRFAIVVEDGVEWIRANQGHSIATINTEEIMTKITDAASIPDCIHGTYRDCIHAILRTGLSKMARNHIHFATGMPKSGVISGMRGNCEIAIVLDVTRAMADGIEFYMSANKVILSSGNNGIIDPKYFAQVIDRASGRIIFPETLAGTESKLSEETVIVGPRKSSKKGAKKTGRFVRLEPSSLSEPAEPAEQKFDFLIVLDFEATCLNHERISPQEIIELPSVIVDVRTMAIVDRWATFVRPVHHPILSGFCTELTGIQQEQVDGAPTFVDAFNEYKTWLASKDLLNNRAAFVTCGDWDLNTMLPAQAKLDRVAIPSQMRRWINVKRLMADFRGIPVRGMPDMLEQLNLGLEGRHHSGIDDCKNIARCCIKLLEQGCVFDYTR